MSRPVPVLAVAAAVTAWGACMEPNVETVPVVPAWAEWPAEILEHTPFEVRLVGYAPGCYPHQELRVEVHRSQENILIYTVWRVEGTSDPACDPGYFDTLVTMAGLPATPDSIYRLINVPTERPFVTMGTVLVHVSGAVSDRLKGAGTVVGVTDIEGCAVMQRPFDLPIPVENPPAATWLGFVRGYYFTPAAPLCGQTRAFHLDELRESPAMRP